MMKIALPELTFPFSRPSDSNSASDVNSNSDSDIDTSTSIQTDQAVSFVQTLLSKNDDHPFFKKEFLLQHAITSLDHFVYECFIRNPGKTSQLEIFKSNQNTNKLGNRRN